METSNHRYLHCANACWRTCACAARAQDQQSYIRVSEDLQVSGFAPGHCHSEDLRLISCTWWTRVSATSA